MGNDFLARAAALRHAAEDPATDAQLVEFMIQTATDMEAAAADDEAACLSASIVGDPGVFRQLSADPRGDGAAG